MSKLADAAAGGAATGKGLAGLGAQIAQKVQETKKDGEKLSVRICLENDYVSVRLNKWPKIFNFKFIFFLFNSHLSLPYYYVYFSIR